MNKKKSLPNSIFHFDKRFQCLNPWSNPNLFHFWVKMLFYITCLFYWRASAVPQISANTKSSVLSVTMVKLTGLSQAIQVQLSCEHRLSSPFLNFWRQEIHCFIRRLLFKLCRAIIAILHGVTLGIQCDDLVHICCKMIMAIRVIDIHPLT